MLFIATGLEISFPCTSSKEKAARALHKTIACASRVNIYLYHFRVRAVLLLFPPFSGRRTQIQDEQQLSVFPRTVHNSLINLSSVAVFTTIYGSPDLFLSTSGIREMFRLQRSTCSARHLEHVGTDITNKRPLNWKKTPVF